MGTRSVDTRCPSIISDSPRPGRPTVTGPSSVHCKSFPIDSSPEKCYRPLRGSLVVVILRQRWEPRLPGSLSPTKTLGDSGCRDSRPQVILDPVTVWCRVGPPSTPLFMELERKKNRSNRLGGTLELPSPRGYCTGTCNIRIPVSRSTFFSYLDLPVRLLMIVRNLSSDKVVIYHVDSKNFETFQTKNSDTNIYTYLLKITRVQILVIC